MKITWKLVQVILLALVISATWVGFVGGAWEMASSNRPSFFLNLFFGGACVIVPLLMIKFVKDFGLD